MQKDKKIYYMKNAIDKSASEKNPNLKLPMFTETKFNPPYFKGNLVFREKLLKKLDKGNQYKLVLIIAPAGFGKSTLLAQWTFQNNMPTSWLSFDKKDNDPVLFWSYFIYSLNRLRPEQKFGEQSLDLLYSCNRPSIESILTVLINEINQCKEDLVMVLDDFQFINNPVIYESFKYLIDYLPPGLHIYISSRVVPPLSLSGLRGKNYLLEISTNELKFDLYEKKSFFNKNLDNFKLSRSELNMVNKRLDGWVAGMQLLVVAINSSGNKTHSIHNLLKEKNIFSNYLCEEILKHQSNEVKDFLIKTSILQKMNVSLCEKITGCNNSKNMLTKLEKQNLFVTPLDDGGYWYSYHQLFAETLKNYLRENKPDLFLELHKKAASWHKEKGMYREAIFHAIKGKDHEAAASWILQEAKNFFRGGKLETLYHLLSMLPQKAFGDRPLLQVYNAWTLMHLGKIKEAEHCYFETVDFINEKVKGEKNKEAKHDVSLDFLQAQTKTIKGYLDLLKEKEGAYLNFIDILKNLKPESPGEMIVFNMGEPSLLQTNSGKKGSLKKVTEILTSKITEDILQKHAFFSYGYAILGEIYYEKDELKKAKENLKTALKSGKEKISPGSLVPIFITMSKIKIKEGKYQASLQYLDILENEIRERKYTHWLNIIRAHKVRIALKMDDERMVCHWLEMCGMTIYDEIALFNYYNYSTMVRVLIYLGQIDRALELSERLSVLLEDKGGVGYKIEILLLHALASKKKGSLEKGIKSLEESLELGAREGYYRTFIDEGKALQELIEIYAVRYRLSNIENDSNGDLSCYLEDLRQGFFREYGGIVEKTYGLTEALTKREWEVLKLLVSGFSNKDIASSLYITITTVKAHVKNIYRKLGVNSRAKAIARIIELNLLDNDNI